jgi:cation diffusion facilitator CzcD-associated flavoprotein CzcO
MSTTAERDVQSAVTTEHFDVVIVGAGISGIGSAYHLLTQNPERSFVMLEAMDHFGGTWYTHRYPGVRSDSDLYTFGYRSSRGRAPRSRPRPKFRSTSAR